MTFGSQGERDKFDILYERYKRLMLHKANGILRDPMLAEDAVSEGFLRVYRNLHKIDDPASPQAAAFVMTVVRRVALTMLGRQQRARAAPEAPDLPGDADVEEEVVSGMGFEEILAAVGRLGDESRSIFLLKFAYDLSHREIGRIMGMTENSVTVRLHRLRRKLSGLWAEGGACL